MTLHRIFCIVLSLYNVCNAVNLPPHYMCEVDMMKAESFTRYSPTAKILFSIDDTGADVVARLLDRNMGTDRGLKEALPARVGTRFLVDGASVYYGHFHESVSRVIASSAVRISAVAMVRHPVELVRSRFFEWRALPDINRCQRARGSSFVEFAVSRHVVQNEQYEVLVSGFERGRECGGGPFPSIDVGIANVTWQSLCSPLSGEKNKGSFESIDVDGKSVIPYTEEALRMSLRRILRRHYQVVGAFERLDETALLMKMECHFQNISYWPPQGPSEDFAKVLSDEELVKNMHLIDLMLWEEANFLMDEKAECHYIHGYSHALGLLRATQDERKICVEKNLHIDECVDNPIPLRPLLPYDCRSYNSCAMEEPCSRMTMENGTHIALKHTKNTTDHVGGENLIHQQHELHMNASRRNHSEAHVHHGATPEPPIHRHHTVEPITPPNTRMHVHHNLRTPVPAPPEVVVHKHHTLPPASVSDVSTRGDESTNENDIVVSSKGQMHSANHVHHHFRGLSETEASST